MTTDPNSQNLPHRQLAVAGDVDATGNLRLRRTLLSAGAGSKDIVDVVYNSQSPESSSIGTG